MELLEQLQELRKSFSQLSYEIEQLFASANQEDMERLAPIYTEMSGLKGDVKAECETLEQFLVHIMPTDLIITDSGLTLERRTGSDRKAWDHQSLASEVARRVAQSAVDMDTGEITLTPEEMMVKMLEYAAPSYWRVGELNKIGINADRYCEKSEGKTSVIVKKSAL